MNATHTKGPWIYSASNGKPLSDRITVNAGDCVVAQVNNRSNAFANAELLAAAPELLEALRLLADRAKHAYEVQNHVRTGYPDLWSGLYACEQRARAAIAKAEGKS